MYHCCCFSIEFFFFGSFWPRPKKNQLTSIIYTNENVKTFKNKNKNVNNNQIYNNNKKEASSTLKKEEEEQTKKKLKTRFIQLDL